MRKVNVVLLAGAVLALCVLGGAACFVRSRQVQRNAFALIERARKEELQGNRATAAEALHRYLGLRPNDSETWRSYARLTDESTTDPRRREQVYLVYQEALSHNPDDQALERRSVDLALELRPERTADARRFLKDLIGRAANKLEKSQDATDVASAAVELAELKELDGKCLLLDADFPAAASEFEEAISYDPSRLFSYVQLARLERGSLGKDPREADREIDWMLASNPGSGHARLERFRYLAEFRPPAPEADLKQALQLAPEDPDVLLTAALAAEQKQDLAGARGYLQKGMKRHAGNIAFPIALAELETRDGHLDRAEAVLRQADKEHPSPDLAFRLADTLSSENKIDGENQAESYITRLRDAGMGETLGRYLDAKVLFQRKQWAEAIPKIESARALLKSLPQLDAPLNRMLVECYGRVGAEEQRLRALRDVAENRLAGESTRVEYARSLVRAGKLDDAIAVLAPLAERVPELRLDLLSALIQKANRTPRDPAVWREVERQLSLAGKALPGSAERLTLLRAEMLVARDRMDEAGKLLTEAQAKDPRNLPYRLALARVAQRQGKGVESLKIIDQAEKDLGPSLSIQLARLDHWGRQGDEAAKAAVAKLAETRAQVAAADRPAFLDGLTVTEIRLREPARAREHLAELAALQPENLQVRLTLFDLAIEAGDHAAAADLVQDLHKLEGDRGTHWRFAQAALLIEKARKGVSQDLEQARVLAAEIEQQRPDWWAGPTLTGELADLAGNLDLAIEQDLRAVDLGNVQPSFARRLVGLLYQRSRFAEIDHVAQVLRERGVALDEITLIKAVEAMQKQSFDEGIALVRQVYSDTSTRAGDHLALGRFYATAGRNEAAGKEFRRAVELGPGVPEAWLAHVQYLTQTRQIDQAKSAIDAAQQALPADRADVTLALCWMAVGDLKRAEAQIGKALNSGGKPADPEALKIATIVAAAQNRPDKVEEFLNWLEQLAQVSRTDKAWIHRTRAELLLGRGRLAAQDQALALVEQNLKDDPGSVADQLLKGNLLALRPSRRGEAVDVLEPLGAANRLDSNEQFLLAQLYLAQREEQKYQDEMFKLLKSRTRSPQHLAHFVNYWIGQNQLDQAERWLGELKQVEPNGIAALELEARLLDVRNRKPQVLALLVARGRQIPDQIGLVADLLSRYGFTREAEQAYKAYIARDPREPERVLALARFLVAQDRVNEAMTIFRKAWSTCRPEMVAAAAISVFDAPSADEAQKHQVEAWSVEALQKRPDSAVLVGGLSAIWIRQNHYDEAETLCRRTLASDPENVGALNALAWLLAMRDQGKPQEALELINRAAETLGENVSVLDTQAVVRIKAGQIDQAVEALRSIRKQAPKVPRFAFHLAWALQAQGQSDLARKEMGDAEKLGLKAQMLDALEQAVLQQMHKDLPLGQTGSS